jgi:hypothetical protein
VKLYTDRKRIRAAIQAAQLKATTSVAAFRASVAVPYIRIKAVTGRFVKRLQFVENLSLASLPSLLFGRPLSDSAGVTDLPDVVPNKRPTDIVGAVDLLDPFQIAKGFFENPKIEEGDYFAEDYTVYGYTITSYEMELRKPFSEPLGVADLPDITSDKPLADGVGAFDGILSKQFIAATSTVLTADITDVSTSYLIRVLNNTARAREALAGDMSKPLSDTGGAGDTPAITFARPVADAGGAADSEALQFVKALADASAATDTEVWDFTKGNSDTAVATAGVPVFSATRVAADAANAAESIVLKPILGIIDTPAVSDSGSLRMQDYCSFDYFAQDYVGTSLTF